MRVRAGNKKSGKKNVPGVPGRNLPPAPRQLPQRPIAPPRRIPPKGR
ncbi:hypothetical protein [Nonomuraea cavernae]|uniref:Uncharacterized protein n=1 Tax=Nonomuraea cavernae TaxID=2045107 RepID=A0A917YVP4_9ACTN|nr:hypothetical protein [Nonomuraea cavernae]MCA2187238.1 hypothetical protein [Nonomuraea cavernae]GGO68001.1 hypothetical protein GCM10012289_25750 [Nonomuraea cavernae]